MTVLVELFASGGPVMFFIAGASFVAWYVALWAWVQAGYLLKQSQKISVPLLQAPAGRYNKMCTAQRPPDPSKEAADYRYRCFRMESLTTRLKRSLSLIAMLALVLPLLGLLGTVLGMLISFEVIQVHGTSQPRLLAGGIGQALITTQAGLWTAVPVLFFHHIIRSRVQLINNEMEVVAHVIQTRFGEGKVGGTTRASAELRSDNHEANHIGDG